jgi:hypothetical protein
MNTNTFFFFNSLSDALGKTITNIENAPIHLDGVHIQNFFGLKNQLVTRLTDHYMVKDF